LSGLLPDQTLPAYQLAINNSLANTVMFCDLQLTKDQKGLCRTDLRLDNSTNINDIYPNQSNSYIVNGKKLSGYFSIDFPGDQIVGESSGVAGEVKGQSRL
jgi:glycerophosphoryl diester phosphodiesterase